MRRLPKLKKGEPVAVRWIDAAGRHGWQAEEELAKIEGDAYCHTLGWFIKKDAKGFFLCHTRDRFEEMKEPYLTVIFIPSHYIESIQRLRVKK